MIERYAPAVRQDFLKDRYLPNCPDEVHTLIRRYPLATVVSHDGLGLSRNHLPLILDPAKGANGA